MINIQNVFLKHIIILTSPNTNAISKSTNSAR